MQYCVDHPEEISKLAKVKAQVSEVKGVMMENIEKVFCSGLSVSLVFIRLFAKEGKQYYLLQLRYIVVSIYFFILFFSGQLLSLWLNA